MNQTITLDGVEYELVPVRKLGRIAQRIKDRNEREEREGIVHTFEEKRERFMNLLSYQSK